MKKIALRALTVTATILIGMFAIGAGSAFAYGYEYSYDVGQDVRAEDAFDYVKTHFTSVFPPASLTDGNTCGDDLFVGMECDLTGFDKGHILIEEVGSRHFVVRSLNGHAEGANKVINFTFEAGADGMLRLRALANGQDNLWQKIPLAKRGNRLMADTMWSEFASNVTIQIYLGNIPRRGELSFS